MHIVLNVSISNSENFMLQNAPELFCVLNKEAETVWNIKNYVYLFQNVLFWTVKVSIWGKRVDLIVSNIFIVVVGFILEMARDGHKP